MTFHCNFIFKFSVDWARILIVLFHFIQPFQTDKKFKTLHIQERTHISFPYFYICYNTLHCHQLCIYNAIFIVIHIFVVVVIYANTNSPLWVSLFQIELWRQYFFHLIFGMQMSFLFEHHFDFNIKWTCTHCKCHTTMNANEFSLLCTTTDTHFFDRAPPKFKCWK